MSAPRILVVDDDAELRGLIARFLRANGLAVDEAADARQMDARLEAGRPDCIVLDLMMPGESGLDVLRRLPPARRPPVIMLSALGEDVDRIVGLDAGADDYLAKPCNPRELLARIQAVLRRAPSADAPRQLGCGAWTLDLLARRVARPGVAEIELSEAEFRILAELMQHPGEVLSRERLLDATRGEGTEVYDRTIDVTISRLRKKLGAGLPIATLRGEGYRLDLAADAP
jgi:two-component system OmpR family response regulator